MKTTSTLLLTSLLATSFLSAGPVAKAVVLDNNGNHTNSIANKAVKVEAAKQVADSDNSALNKTVKAKAIRGDYKHKRAVKHR